MPSKEISSLRSETSPRHREAFDALWAWGQTPTPVPSQDVESFLGYVQDGLMNERRKRPVHNPAHIAWAVGKLRSALERYNAAAQLASHV